MLWSSVAIFLSCAVNFSHAILDFYVDSNETNRLVGFGGELWYVKNGVKHEYASSYTVPVKSDIDTLYFVWQNKNFTVGDFVDKYTLNVVYQPNEAIGEWNSSLGTHGDVPHKRLERFCITLPCTGKADAEIDVTIKLSILAKKNHTLYEFNLKRKKICTKRTDVMQELPSEPEKPSKEDIYLGAVDARISSVSSSTKFLAMSVSGLVVLLVVGFTVFFILRKNNKKSTGADMEAAMTSQLDPRIPPHLGNVEEGDQLLYPGAELTGQSLLEPFYDYGPSQCDSVMHPPTAYSGVHIDLHQLNSDEQQLNTLIRTYPSVDPSTIEFVETLLSGTFSVIYRGRMIGYAEQFRIKAMKPCASASQTAVMFREGLRFREIDHENVNKLWACIPLNPSDPHSVGMLLYNGANYDNLKSLLLTGKWKKCLPIGDLVCLGVQALRGLLCLHENGIVHMDVAARNCIVFGKSGDLSLQITDSALSRDLFPDDYHCLSDNQNRPVKWMAYESLLADEYSSASDVWSFGVLMWEIMSFNCPPFDIVEPDDLVSFLAEGTRMEKPPDCPDKLYGFMMSCWRLDPENRPTMPGLLREMTEFHEQLKDYA